MPRHEENRVQKCYRISPETADKLNAIALSLGYVYGARKETGEKIPGTGEMLDAIANGEIILTVVQKKDKNN